jgi:hypothetical protein
MDNPNLVFHIPENEITDTASFLDAVKKRIVEHEANSGKGIFLRGPAKGICIELVHPDFDEDKPDKTLTIHISFESYLP